MKQGLYEKWEGGDINIKKLQDEITPNAKQLYV